MYLTDREELNKLAGIYEKEILDEGTAFIEGKKYKKLTVHTPGSIKSFGPNKTLSEGIYKITDMKKKEWNLVLNSKVYRVAINEIKSAAKNASIFLK